MGDRGSDSGDFAYLIRKILGHDVDVFRKFLPDAVDAGNLCLTTEDAFRADLTGDTRHLATKDLQLVHHSVDSAFERCDFRVHFQRVNLHLHREVTVGDLGDDATNFPQGFLKGFVGLLMLAEFSFQEDDVFVLDLGEGTTGVLFLLQ